MNMGEIFAVINTTYVVVKIRPEKKFRPYFHYCLSSAHHCEDRSRIQSFNCILTSFKHGKNGSQVTAQIE